MAWLYGNTESFIERFRKTIIIRVIASPENIRTDTAGGTPFNFA